MHVERVVLAGRSILLEPLTAAHTDALAAASSADPSLYRWSAVPQGEPAMRQYVQTALSWQQAGRALPFAIIRREDGVPIGSTRFFDLEQWVWPEGHPRQGRALPDGCELGYTWLTRPAIRTAANTEAKLLMLTHAFEAWGVLRVCLHTDVRNERSRAAMERMGARFEGVLRAHRLATDGTARDSARYSIVAAEWPEVNKGLRDKLEAPRGPGK